MEILHENERDLMGEDEARACKPPSKEIFEEGDATVSSQFIIEATFLIKFAERCPEDSIRSFSDILANHVLASLICQNLPPKINVVSNISIITKIHVNSPGLICPIATYLDMLPTPDTSHVAYERIYEPAEDSFLFLDTLCSAGETAFLHDRFRDEAPLVVEIGPGSGVIIAFANAHAQVIFGSRNILTAAVDVNNYACKATKETVNEAATEHARTHGKFLGVMQGDLVAPLKDGSVDVLIFNPPYVPTSEMPRQPTATDMLVDPLNPTFQDDSYLLSLSYAGGIDGMEITNELIDRLPEVLSPRGCAYILLCAQNKPEEVKQRIRNFGSQWKVEMVGSSGKQAGWEKLQIIRIWREQSRWVVAHQI